MQRFVRTLLAAALALVVLVMCTTQSVLADDTPVMAQPSAESVPVIPGDVTLKSVKKQLPNLKSKWGYNIGGGQGVFTEVEIYYYSYWCGGKIHTGVVYPRWYWNDYGRSISCPYGGYTNGDWHYCPNNPDPQCPY